MEFSQNPHLSIVVDISAPPEVELGFSISQSFISSFPCAERCAAVVTPAVSVSVCVCIYVCVQVYWQWWLGEIDQHLLGEESLWRVPGNRGKDLQCH